MRPGSAPRTIEVATRCASVLVLPVPAPAMMSRGPGISRGSPAVPYSAAARWLGFRPLRCSEASGMVAEYKPKGKDRRQEQSAVSSPGIIRVLFRILGPIETWDSVLPTHLPRHCRGSHSRPARMPARPIRPGPGPERGRQHPDPRSGGQCPRSAHRNCDRYAGGFALQVSPGPGPDRGPRRRHLLPTQSSCQQTSTPYGSMCGSSRSSSRR